MWFDRKPVTWRLHPVGSGDSLHFTRQSTLIPKREQAFDDRVAERDIEFLILHFGWVGRIPRAGNGICKPLRLGLQVNGDDFNIRSIAPAALLPEG